MGTSWVILKYMPDLRRREPRNVAIAVLHDHGVEIRSIGERADGSVDGNRTRSHVKSADNLRGWLSYWTYLAERQAPIEEWASERPGDNYLVEVGGRVLLGEEPNPKEFADKLYGELVAQATVKPGEEPDSVDFTGKVDILLREAGLLDRGDYLGSTPVPGSSGETFEFPHAWQNGHLTVAVGMPRFSTVKARDLLWQFEHLPSDATGRLVFTSRPLSDSDNATAGLLDRTASVLPVDSTVDDVRDAFDRAGG